MIKLTYDLFYMSRMLKDKLLYKIYDYYYSLEYQEVERMDPCIDSIFNNLYNLTYEPTNIIENIYLGNAYNASNYSNLIQNNIGLIVNITSEISNYYSYSNEFEYYNIDIEDNNNNHIQSHIDNVLNKIHEYKKANPDKNILIHCFMGSSRSASLVVAYLYKNHNMSIDDAIVFIKNKRELVNINTTFIKDLHIWSNL